LYAKKNDWRATRAHLKKHAVLTPVSLTPCFSWVFVDAPNLLTFLTVSHAETVETVLPFRSLVNTQLKQGVNEMPA
jgi:hypothetical protein